MRRVGLSGSVLAVGVVSLVSLACMSPRAAAPRAAEAPTTNAAPPLVAAPPAAASVPAATASAAPAASASPAVPVVRGPTPKDFTGSFLDTNDVGARFQAEFLPSTTTGRANHYGHGPKPRGLRWVADCTWVDVHGNEAYNRVVESRWLFDSEASASLFADRDVRDLRDNARSEDAVGPAFGDESHALKGIGPGDALHFAYVVRVGSLVVQLWFQQGPRSPIGALKMDLITPLVRRAAERAAAMLEETAAPKQTAAAP